MASAIRWRMGGSTSDRHGSNVVSGKPPCLPRRVGVILLDTRFPRPPGDIGHPATFAGLGLFEVVPGASVKRAMGVDGDGLAPDFISARDRLIERGAEIVTTSCGILVNHQLALQRDCPVPVVTSSLLQSPGVVAVLGAGQRVGVIAMDSRTLNRAVLDVAGAPESVVVVGLEHGDELFRVLSADDPSVALDPVAAEHDVLAAGAALMQAHSDVGAIVLECANLPPYRAALERHLGIPVDDILTLLAKTLDQADAARIRPAGTL